MIKTNCEKCCFAKKDTPQRGCLAGQFCIEDEIYLSTPGCCRLQRSYQWMNNQDDTDIDNLIVQAKDGAGISDGVPLILFFNEELGFRRLGNTIDNLWTTNYFSEIIIADITDPDERTNSLIKYIKSIDIKKIKIDYTVDETWKSPVLVLRRIARQLSCKYFLVISAGSVILDAHVSMEKLDSHLKQVKTRSIYWYFPKQYGDTILVEKEPIDGLYLAAPYKYLVDRSSDIFIKQLNTLEEDSKMCLSYLFDECVILNDNG